MTDAEPFAEPAVVTMPAEIDISNAGAAATQLRAAIGPRISVVVADLTKTAFCDSSGMRILLLAHDWAAADGVELRLAVPPGPALVILKLIGLDRLLPVYPTLDEALAAPPGDLAPLKAGIPQESAGPSAVLSRSQNPSEPRRNAHPTASRETGELRSAASAPVAAAPMGTDQEAASPSAPGRTAKRQEVPRRWLPARMSLFAQGLPG